MFGHTLICLYSGWSEFYRNSVVCDLCNLHLALRAPIAVFCDATDVHNLIFNQRDLHDDFFSFSAQHPSFLSPSPQILAASKVPKPDIHLLYLVRLLFFLWVPVFWGTVWKLHRQKAKIILGERGVHFIFSPSLQDHSLMLSVVQCPKAIASYTLFSFIAVMRGS